MTVKIKIDECLKGMEERDENTCKCGCADELPENVGGMCLWCTHVYRSSKLEPTTRWTWGVEVNGMYSDDYHFLTWCPGAPQELKDNIVKRQEMASSAPENEEA